MTRWIDVRRVLPPPKLMVLCFLRDANEEFEDVITSGRCYYDLKVKDDDDYYEYGEAKWVLENIKGDYLVGSVQPRIEKGLIVSKEARYTENHYTSEWSALEVTHWTLIPEYRSSIWIDIKKYPPPPGLQVLVYMKDSCEDSDDFITVITASHFKVNNRTHANNPDKYYYTPVCWTLYPSLPKLIDDSFI